MAKVVIDLSTKVEKMKPKLRRFSTGNSATTDPKPLPNHLRASIGSCHDFCKYGYKPHFPSQSAITQNQENLKTEGNKIKRIKDLKPKPHVRSDQSADHKTFLKSTKNQQIGRKGVIRPSLPLASSYVTIRTSKRCPKEDTQIKNSFETIFENVPEKIIHVVEPNDENQKEDHAKKTGKVVPIKEKDSSSRSKLKMKSTGKALENVISVRGDLRHQAMEQINTNQDWTNNVMDETAGTKLVNISKNKVKALVDAFETLINNQESES